MKVKKRFFSLLLAICLVVGLLPTPALAAETRVTVGNFNVEGDGSTYSYSNGVLTINNGANLTISTNSQTSDRIVISDNANVKLTLAGVTIVVPSGGLYEGNSAIDVGSGATLSITLSENSSNTITGGSSITGNGGIGIHVPESATLLIQGEGNVSVSGGASTAMSGGNGIGGKPNPGKTGETCGTVIILSTGNVTISGGNSNMSGSNGTDIGGGFGTQKGDDG